MNVRFFCLSAIVSIALVGCSDDDDSTPSTTDTGVVTSDTGSPIDTGGGVDDGLPIDTGSASDAPGDTPAALSCEAYCSTVTDNCTGAKNGQYATSTPSPAKVRCIAMCNDMTAGSASDTSGDTVGCRLSHAKLAKDDPTTNCPKAGATGGGTCGASRCDDFCKLAVAHCGTKAPFTNEADCKTKCAAMTFNASAAGGELDQTKQTLNCAQYHLQASYESAAAATTHCPHLTVTSGPCGP
jgi:hypothetical protein